MRQLIKCVAHKGIAIAVGLAVGRIRVVLAKKVAALCALGACKQGAALPVSRSLLCRGSERLASIRCHYWCTSDALLPYFLIG